MSVPSDDELNRFFDCQETRALVTQSTLEKLELEKKMTQLNDTDLKKAFEYVDSLSKKRQALEALLHKPAKK